MDKNSQANLADEYKPDWLPYIDAPYLEAVVEDNSSIDRVECSLSGERAVGKNANGPPSQKGTFCLDGEIEKKKETYPEQAAKFLYSGLSSRRKIMRSPNLKTWTKKIQEFFDGCVFDLTEEQFDKTLKWYCENIGGEYVPLAFSASSFCDKYAQIEHQMEMAEKEKNSTIGGLENNAQWIRLMKGVDEKYAKQAELVECG